MTSFFGVRLLRIPSWNKKRSEHRDWLRSTLGDLPVGRAEMASTTNTSSDKGLVKSMVRKHNFVPESFQHN